MANVNDLIRKAARGAWKRRERALRSKGLATSDAELFAALMHLARDGVCPFPSRVNYGLVDMTNDHFAAIGLPLEYQDVEKNGGNDGEG